MAKRKHAKLICPCCQTGQGQQAEEMLLWLESKCSSEAQLLRSRGWSVACAKSGDLQWACSTCITESRALAGKPRLQKWCDFLPYFAYFDVTLDCEDCQCQFIFSGTEQQFWYETLCFWVQSRPKQCLSCRRARRQTNQVQKQLQQLLQTCDRNNPIQLAQIASCYYALERSQRGSEYVRRARNAARRTQREQELDSFLAKCPLLERPHEDRSD